MRKLIPVALAAILAVALATVALAQGSGATASFSVSPTAAGTKKKPKAASLKLKISNQNTKQTMSRLVLSFGKNVKLSTKGLTKCKLTALQGEGPAGCPKNSSVGKGTAKTLAGVNGPTPVPLTFDVTPFITGSKQITFYLSQQGGELSFTVSGKVSSASGAYRQKLTLEIPPEPAQQYPTGVWNGLVELSNTLSKKKGANSLVTTVGCTKKAHPFKAVLTFVNNTVDAGGTTTATAEGKCS